MAVIDQYLIEMLDRGGSDLHLMIGQPIKARVQGALEDLTDEPVTPDFMLEMLKEITHQSVGNISASITTLTLLMKYPRWRVFVPTCCVTIGGWARFYVRSRLKS